MPLTVSPFTRLPKPPVLPHNYSSLPSTLPPTILSIPGHATTASQQPSPQRGAPLETRKPAYVTSAAGFSAHPTDLIAQNEKLLQVLDDERTTAQETWRAWEQGIKDRELAEKRRRAPGWLDAEQKILTPSKAPGAGSRVVGEATSEGTPVKVEKALLDDQEGQTKDRDDLGAQLEKAFG